MFLIGLQSLHLIGVGYFTTPSNSPESRPSMLVRYVSPMGVGVEESLQRYACGYGRKPVSYSIAEFNFYTFATVEVNYRLEC